MRAVRLPVEHSIHCQAERLLFEEIQGLPVQGASERDRAVYWF
jgi:hypothetical protein